MGKNVVLISFKRGISSYIGLEFPLRYFYNDYFLLLNEFLIQNMKNMLGDSNNINNLCCKATVLEEKKICETS